MANATQNSKQSSLKFKKPNRTYECINKCMHVLLSKYGLLFRNLFILSAGTCVYAKVIQSNITLKIKQEKVFSFSPDTRLDYIFAKPHICITKIKRFVTRYQS